MQYSAVQYSRAQYSTAQCAGDSLTPLTHPPLSPSYPCPPPPQADEDYDSKLPDGSRISTKRTTTTHWTFRGCVSGQQELDWQITGFNGFGFQ